MVSINSKVEYRNLSGFPEYNGDEIHYLKSNEDIYGFKDISIEEMKAELNIGQPELKFYNCILKNSEILENVKKEIFNFPIMTSNETTIDDITYIASSSSEYNTTYEPWKAFTGTFSAETDCWQSIALPTEEAPQWIKIYCGGQDVYPLYWIIGNCGSYTRSMKNFIIQGSNDDEEWTDLVEDVNYSNIANDTFFVYSKVKNVSFKYFRIYITSGNATDLVKVGNWQMIGYLNSPTIEIPSTISESNPLVYLDDNGEQHSITNPLTVNVNPTSYTNIIPHMNSNEEQGWTLTSNKMNGYQYAQPYFMTNGINTLGFHCNQAVAWNNLSITTFTRDTEFTPIAFKIKNRWDYGSGIAYEAIINYNIRNSNNNVIYKTNEHYRLAQNTWQEFRCQLIEPTTSFTFEAYKNDNGNSYHNYGRGFEILVEDENGTDFLEWSHSYIFLNTLTEQLVEEKGNFTISQIKPSTPQKNDLWLSVLDRSKVYKFDGTEWNLQTYIPAALIIFKEYQIYNVYNYPLVTNWYDLTTKSMWKSPKLTPIINEWIVYPHLQQIKNKNYDVILINETPEFGYEQGEIAQGVTMNFASNNLRNPDVYIDDKFIGIRIGNYGTGITITDKNNVRQNITLNNWRLMFRIW